MKLAGLYLFLILAVLATSKDCGSGGVQCPSGTCHYPLYIEGCHIYSSSTSCNECEFNYVKKGNICEYSPPSDYSGCCKAYFQKTGKCSKCAYGLSLINGECREIKVVGCLQKQISGSCTNCAIGFALYGGRCFRNIVGCNKYSSTGVCEKCEDKFVNSGGVCIPAGVIFEKCDFPFVQTDNGQCRINGCDLIYDFGCGRCLRGFRLLPNGLCKEGEIQGCQKYDKHGFCDLCAFPLYKQIEGYCVSINCAKASSSGKCLECNKGFIFGNEGHCTIPNCLVSDQKSCLVCQRGYFETKSGCSIQEPTKVCTLCASGHYLGRDGECHPKNPGCIQYSNGVCKECEPHLYLTQKYECAIKKPGCIYEKGICFECISPFQHTRNNQCKIEGCSEYDNDQCHTCLEPYILTKIGFCTYTNCYEVRDGRCVKCFDGFAIQENGFCYKVDPYCKAYSFSGQCIECKLGHYLVNEKCHQEKFGCNYVDGRCVSCRAPFQYDAKNQNCVIDGCLVYFLGGCKTCSAGYDLRYNSCRLPNCLISYNGHCRECNPDYILRSDGQCVNKDEFCWKYNDDGFCIECAPNYFLSRKTNKCQLREPGCKYNDEDRCFECIKPFHFDGIRCQLYGCLELGWTGCKQCFYPMKVNQYGLCVTENCDRMEKDRCVICKPGFFIADDNSCKKEDPKCLVYGSSYCQKCVKGYRLDHNQICQYTDEHCWDFSKAGHCTNCDRLYFLNTQKKCQIKDQYCAAYSNGKCIECKASFYNHRGLCYPNAKGCLAQKNIKECTKCQSGYKLDFGKCTPQLTKLSWNSIDMDFWGGQSDWEVEKSQEVFSVGKTNKYNLQAAISKGKGKVVYSSTLKGDRTYQVDDYRFENGWELDVSKVKGQYLGVELDRLETFYALDIKTLNRNKLDSFEIQYSENGKLFKSVGKFEIKSKVPGVVQTIYFTPVYAKVIRIVVINGSPNIKIQFYYSNGESSPQQTSTTYIGEVTTQTIEDSLHGQTFYPKEGCVDKQLCWMGLELCEPNTIKGFELLPKTDSKGTIDAVFVTYSKDGVKFDCYDDCSSQKGKNGVFTLNPTVYGTKLRVHPTKWEGAPSCTVSFTYGG